MSLPFLSLFRTILFQFSLGGPFPDLDVNSPCNDQIITNLMHFLEQRISKRNMLRADLQHKREWNLISNTIQVPFYLSLIVFTENDLRKMLMSVEQEHMNLKVENASLKASNSQQKRKV